MRDGKVRNVLDGMISTTGDLEVLHQVRATGRATIGGNDFLSRRSDRCLAWHRQRWHRGGWWSDTRRRRATTASSWVLVKCWIIGFSGSDLPVHDVSNKRHLITTVSLKHQAQHKQYYSQFELQQWTQSETYKSHSSLNKLDWWNNTISILKALSRLQSRVPPMRALVLSHEVNPYRSLSLATVDKKYTQYDRMNIFSSNAHTHAHTRTHSQKALLNVQLL